MKKAQPKDEFIRKRMERRKRMRKRRLIISFCFLIVILLCIGVALSLTVFFPIENITAAGSSVYTSEQIIKASGVSLGDNLFTVSRTEVEEKLKEKLPYIETVKFERQLPDTLKITVIDADEYACYSALGRYYTVSRSGWVLSMSDTAPENLCEIRGTDIECDVGSEIIYKDQEQRELVEKIFDALSTEKLKADRIDISDPIAISLNVEGRFKVDLGTANSVEEKIRHLKGMVQNISSEKTGKINLSMWTSANTSGTFVEGTAE